jgi:large subunit ribosomal protein L25
VPFIAVALVAGRRCNLKPRNLENVMSASFDIKVESREDTGKGASRRLRRTGMVPGIVYGGSKDPAMIAILHNELIQHLENEAFYSHILNLTLGGNTERVVLKDLQRHPAKPFVTHADFMRISEAESIRMLVPLHFTNEKACPGIKMGGLASHSIKEVEITCLPKDLPEFIEVDLSGMEIGDTVHVSELKMPEGVELTHTLDPNAAVVSIHGARTEEEEEGEEGEEGEGTVEE